MFEVWVCMGTGTEPPDLYATLLAAWSVGQKVKLGRTFFAGSKYSPRIWVLKLLVGIWTGQWYIVKVSRGRKSDFGRRTRKWLTNNILHPHSSNWILLCSTKCLPKKGVGRQNNMCAVLIRSRSTMSEETFEGRTRLLKSCRINGRILLSRAAEKRGKTPTGSRQLR